MKPQQQAENRLLRLWQQGLVGALVLCLLAAMLNAFEDEDPVPPELVKRHWLMTINLIRGQWFANHNPEILRWQTEDGVSQVFHLETDSGWPKPVPDCGALWDQIMATLPSNIQVSSQMVESVQQGGQNVLGCQYRFKGAELNYYSVTGSLILRQ